VQSVIQSLTEGVWPYAIVEEDVPKTFDFSTRHIDELGKEFARAQIDQEVSLGRFSAPFGPDLLPGMYSSPIGVVPKPWSDKFRLVNDLSAGPFSLNSRTSALQFGSSNQTFMVHIKPGQCIRCGS
jgi:hypothetical protein